MRASHLCQSYIFTIIALAKIRGGGEGRGEEGEEGGGGNVMNGSPAAGIAQQQLFLQNKRSLQKTRDRQRPTERDHYNHILEIKQLELHLLEPI